MAEDMKSFSALVNGIARRKYYGENELTDDFLKSEIYKETPQEDFQHLVTKCNNIIKSMVSTDMDFNQLEAFLISQVKKKEGGLTEDQASVFRKFWKNHKSKIHESLIAQTTWNNTLSKFSWRIDYQSQSRQEDQMNVPTAIMELHVDDKSSSEKKSDVLRFEMNEEKLFNVLQSLKEIEEEIDKHCKQ